MSAITTTGSAFETCRFIRVLRATVIVVAAALLLQAPWLAAEATSTPFDSHFEDATLRVDYYHHGDAESEHVTVDRLYRQGLWAAPHRLVRQIPALGGYAVSLYDPTSGELLFSRGFDSYFAEYATTAPAAEGVARTYHESVLLPYPRHPVVLTLEARSRRGEVREVLRLNVDPEDPMIATEPPRKGVTVVGAHVAGPARSCLDIAVVGEGYTSAEKELFQQDLQHVSELILKTEPYASRAAGINIRGVLLPSADSGCDEPTRVRYRDTSIGATFNSLGSERYLLTEDNRALRDVAANVPYDTLLIMVNHDRYGGGGIYNLYATFTVHNQWSDYLVLHEMGHSFAGLADEYYSSSVAYNDFYPRDHEPAEANITALLDPAELKWRHLVGEGVTIPTPWEKAEYDAMDQDYQQKRQELNERIAAAARAGDDPDAVAALEAEAELLSRKAAEQAQGFLAQSDFVGVVGAFEGAGYSSEGLYRPMLDCIMFSKGVRPFCAVCSDAVAATVDSFRELTP